MSGREPSWRRRVGAMLAAGLALAVLLTLVARLDRPRDALGTIPAINLADMQPRVAERLSEARGRIMQDPSSAEAWGRMGAVCHAHRLHDAALACYGRAQALAPSDFRWPYLLAIVQEFEGAPRDEVAALLVTAIRLDPDYVPAYVRLGELQLEGGRLIRAADSFEHALRLQPALAVAHRGLGRVSLRTGETQRAVQHFEQAIELAPRDRAAWSALAQACARSGDMRRATEAVERSRRLPRAHGLPDPVYAEVKALGVSPQHCADRAVLLLERGEYALAARDLAIVADAQPNDSRIHLYLGISYAAIGRHDEAVQSLEAALQLDDGLVEANVQIGRILLQRNQLDDAIRYFRRARELAPGDGTVLKWLGVAFARLGELARAVEVLREALVLVPGDAQVRYNLATGLIMQGQTHEAIVHLRKVVALDPGYADAYYNLGLALEETGQRAEAIVEYRRAVDIDPGHAAVRALRDLSGGR